MTAQAELQKLLRRVAVRLRIDAVAATARVSLLALGGLYAALLLLSRLLSLIPDLFEPLTLLVVPCGALAFGLVFGKRPTIVEAARLTDAAARTKDLFLTAVLIENAAGEFRPVVLQQAEKVAATLKSPAIVALRWWRPLRDAVIVLAVLLLGGLFLPQLDPFGKEEARKQVTQRKKELAESRKATELRKTNLEQKIANRAESKELEKAFEELKKTFQMARPEERKRNLEQLGERQKELGELWKKANEEKLRSGLSQGGGMQQQFGGKDAQKQSAWKQQIGKGDLSGLKNELSEIKKLARKLQKSSDPKEKEAARQELKKRLEGVKDFLALEMNSKPVDKALERALEQLGMSAMGGLSQEGLKALQESLELSEMEMENMAQAMQNMQSVEEALKALQMAKSLNQQGKLDGVEGSGQCESIADYAKLYAKLMGGDECACDAEGDMEGEGECDGDGRCKKCGKRKKGKGKGGMKGPGTGEGGKAPEDDTVKSDYKSEQSKTSLGAGKILMEIKERKVSDPGVAAKNFNESVKQVKQGVGEAIINEQVPPGYHDAIKKYFDTLDGDAAKGK